uniref:G-protein coupled receptors family 1 profile domain-containing protein n=1 Tax=Meloidogyne enterolobii TaxID=390850 RepID=A0A6V7TWE3_MELEN|nr:unnamed protein product [Meloidogyne enterolobii]
MLMTISTLEGYSENNIKNNINIATTKTFISIPETSSSFPLIINSSRQNNLNLMDNQESSNNGEDQEEAGCTNSHIISAQTIISFTENMDAVMFVLTLFSSFLQLYVMFAALKHIKRKTSDKCLHVFLLSMTMADFLLTALCYPVELAPRAGLINKFPRFISALMHILCWIGLIVSSLSLVFLNLDKLIFFRFPLRYSTCFTRARAIYLALGCWFLSTAFVLFAWSTESFHCVDEDCVTLAIFPNRLYIYLPFMICVGVIPTITSLSVAIYIMKVVSEHRRQIKSQGKGK